MEPGRTPLVVAVMAKTPHLYDLYQNAAHWLNLQAWRQQSKDRKPRHFIPCAKAIVFMDACKSIDQRVSEEVLNEANGTHCSCHNSTTKEQLFDMMYDDRSKQAHYDGTSWKLEH